MTGSADNTNGRANCDVEQFVLRAWGEKNPTRWRCARFAGLGFEHSRLSSIARNSDRRARRRFSAATGSSSGLGQGDFYISFRRAGQWTPARQLGALVNSPDQEVCPVGLVGIFQVDIEALKLGT
jgi:hypothetical protein